jgi:hypothetical protein
MNKQVFLLPLLFAALTLSAQKNKKKNNQHELPDFGVVDKADLEMKECDFDKKAEAVVLIDDGKLNFLRGTGDLELKQRTRIKILSEKGLERANIHLTYHSFGNDESISGLEAQTYNLDAAGNVVITKVEKKLVYEKKINKKFTEKVFTFPEVKVGSIIEYKYRHTGIGLIDWYFQSSIPVKFSRFATEFPADIEVSTHPSCSREYEFHTDYKGSNVVKTYVMTNEPAFRSEPYIINEDFYKDRLETKFIAITLNGIRNSRTVDWLKVIKHLMEDEDFGLQIKKNIPRTAELDVALKTVTNPYLRMKTVYKYVQDNMAWNEYTGIWAQDGVKSAWKDKKGTVGEINLILVNLLKDAGLVTHPVLVSTHDNGIVNAADPGTYDEPGFNQFNKVMAYVEIGEKTYVLDASQKVTPVHMIPSEVLMTEGLVIEKLETGDWGWRTLWNNNAITRNVIQLTGAIKPDGKMEGEATISSFDYARLPRLSLAKKGKEDYTKEYLSGNPGLNIDDVSFENLDSDSLPLVQKIKFSQVLDASGDYRHFTANLLTGLETNPFVADSRAADVFFGTNQNYVVLGSFMVPEGYEPEALPKNVKMIMPDTSITISRVSQFSKNVISTRVQLDFKKSIFGADEYPELQEFYKQLYALLNEQYVIRKKTDVSSTR